MKVITAAPETGSAVPTTDIGLSFIDGEPTAVIDVTPVSTSADVTPSPSARRGVLARVTQATVNLVARLAGALVRGVVRAVSGGYRFVKRESSRQVRARAYRPRHATRRTWYARQRSTSQYVRARRDQAKEGELRYPPEFIGLLETFIETLRYEDAVFHPRAEGQHFICS